MIKVSKSQRRALDIVVDMINNSYNSDKGEQALTLICGILNVDIDVDIDVDEPVDKILPGTIPQLILNPTQISEPDDVAPIDTKPATIGEPDGAAKAITSQLVDRRLNMNCVDCADCHAFEGELIAPGK